MKIEDLGNWDGDIVVFGGIYSNLQALQAFLGWVSEAKISRSNCICTGDLVAYCANPAEVTALMREANIKSIAGNCEVQLAAGADDCGCGFDEGSACDLASKGWYPFAAEQVAGHRDYYAELPDILTFTAFEKRYAVIHGGVKDVSRFLWPTSDATEFAEEIAAVEALTGAVDGVICGHCGVAFERMIDGRHWINAGVIGMPPNDGRADTRFAVLSGQGVRFHRLSYDANAAAKSLRQAGLNNGYDLSLTSGHWPSEDVFPPQMRR